MKKFIFITIVLSFLVTPVMAKAQTIPCSTEVPSTVCSATDMDTNPSSVKMCFTSLDVSSDNGSTWKNIFTVTGGVELDITNLGDGVDLSSVSSVTSGTLDKSTSYPCARAAVTRVIYTPTGGTACDAKSYLENNQGLSFDTMYMRGSDDCAGDSSYPEFTPFKTLTSDTVALKFNVQLAGGGPKFLLIPTSGGELDLSNAGYVQLTASNINTSVDNFYCAVFKDSDPTAEGSAPDVGGGSGTVDSDAGTATCTIGVPVGSFQGIAAFQDIDGSGANEGPQSGDLVCNGSSFTVTAGDTTEVECTMQEF